jgi:hypothetical protein
MEVNTASGARGEYGASERVRELAFPVPARAASQAAGSALWIAALGGIQPGLRGAGSAWLVQGSVAWRTLLGLGFELSAAATVAPSRVEGTAGVAELSSQWLAAGPSLALPIRSTAWRAELGVALLASRVVAHGQAVVPPWTATTETAYSPGVYFHGGPSFSRGRWQLRFDLGALFLSSPANIYLADQRAAVWGAPVAHVALGVGGRVWP